MTSHFPSAPPALRALLVLIALLVLLAAGCGSGSEGRSREESTGGTARAAVKPKPPSGGGDTSAGFKPPRHHDSGGGSKQFLVKGGDNSIEEFGSEAAAGAFDQAAAALHGYLDARAAHAWAAACGYLDAQVVTQLREVIERAGGDSAPCAAVVADAFDGVPAAPLHEAAVADVGALRVEGSRGFLLFHGPRGAVYVMPMLRDGDTWKVGAVAPSALG